jgi:ATP-dependent DNA helicase RecG
MTHRDFTLLGAIHVQWTDQGLHFSSPGGLPEGVELTNLLVTPPRPRNPLLADAFKRAGIVERTGRGVDTIYYGQLRYGRPLPRYAVTSSSVSVLGRLVGAGILDARGEGRGRSYHLSAAMYRVLGDRAGYVRVRGFEPAQQEQMVIQYAREHGQITRGEAAQLCKLSGAQASRLLKRVATVHPDLRLEGEKRGAKYVWHGARRSGRRDE